MLVLRPVSSSRRAIVDRAQTDLQPDQQKRRWWIGDFFQMIDPSSSCGEKISYLSSISSSTTLISGLPSNRVIRPNGQRYSNLILAAGLGTGSRRHETLHYMFCLVRLGYSDTSETENYQLIAKLASGGIKASPDGERKSPMTRISCHVCFRLWRYIFPHPSPCCGGLDEW